MADTSTEGKTKSGPEFSIPLEKNAPEPVTPPAHRVSYKNFADKEETVAKALKWVQSYVTYFDEQPARLQFEADMEMSDEMWRGAKTRTELDSEHGANKNNTDSNVSAPIYHEVVRARTAAEQSIILGNEEELPMSYEPIIGAKEYLEDEGIRIAEEQNIVLAYTYSADKMREKIGRTLFLSNKYPAACIEMGWDYRVEERRDRVVTEWEDAEEDDDGTVHQPRRPKKFGVKKVEITVADNPTLILHDMKDVSLDAMISDIQQQNCVNIRKQIQFGDVWQLQATGQLMNVGKITTKELMVGSGVGEEVMESRQRNAGESPESGEQTNLLDTNKSYIRLPINDETGEWDDETEIPHWYETFWSGDIEGSPICHKLSPLPHNYNKIPVKLVYAKDDDKGAYHLGYSGLIKSPFVMYLTILDQYFDNVRNGNRLGYIAERGTISLRNNVFTDGGNKILWKTPGSQDPKEMPYHDTTNTSLPALKEITDMIKEAGGTNKPFLGEGLGSRASASEARQTFEQGIKPALEDAKYKALQILPFVAEWVKELWRQYSDPKRELMLNYQGSMRTVKPAELWGPLSVRVTSIKNFQDGIMRQQQEDVFINQIFPLMQPLMSPEGQINFFTQIAKNRDMENVDTWWAAQQDFDAVHVAKSENESIMLDGMWDMPKPGENDKIHLEEHKPAYASWMIAVPKEERHPDGERHMKLHIQRHEQQLAEKATPAPQQQQALPGAQPRTPGEVAGDQMGAVEGARENPGRPALSEVEAGI